MPQPEATIRHALKWLYEDPTLRVHSDGPAARRIFAWGEGHVRRAAAGDPDAFREGVNRTRQAMATLDDLVVTRRRLSSAALYRRLSQLPPNQALSPEANQLGREELAQRGPRMGDSEFLLRLLPLVDPLAAPEARSGTPIYSFETGRATIMPPTPRRKRPGCLHPLFLLAVTASSVVVLLVGLVMGGWLPDPRDVTRWPWQPEPIPEGGWYQLYFTTPGLPNPNGPDIALAQLLQGATRSIAVASYELDRPAIAQALLDAHARGVQVRMVTDIDILLDPYEGAAYERLNAAGIPLVAGNSNGIMHDKFAVIDGTTVWTGSWNFTDNDTERHNNVGISIRSPQLAANYTATFLKMWQAQEFGPNRPAGGVRHEFQIGGATVENYFSPEDGVTAQIVAELDAAQHSIRFLAFSLTSDEIGDALLAESASGVAVSGVFETLGSDTDYSEYGRLRQAGLDVRLDGNSYLMHHKLIIVDQQTVIVGSFNFSRNAETINDENLLILHDPALAARFVQEFDRVYAQARAP